MVKTRKQLESENYRRQKETLYTKLKKMHTEYGANMHMVLERNGKVEIFSSGGQMESILGLDEAKGRIFPPPRVVTPRTVATHQRKTLTGNSNAKLAISSD